MPDNLMKQFLADANSVTVTNDELSAISTLANEQLDWERKITQLEADLEHAKDALKQVQEFLLPEAMATVGMSEFKLANGCKITIKDDVYASIRKDFISEAVTWLDENGLGGVVKDQVSVDFGRGDLEAAKLFMAYCKETGVSATEKLSVHPSTLKALVKEQRAKGVEFPDNLFSIAPIRKSVIKTK